MIIRSNNVLSALDTGVYISNLWYLNYSDRLACRITGMTRFASFWIENGEVVLRVNGEYRPYRFTGIETLVIYTSQGATSLECLKLKDEASRYEIWVLNDLDNLLIMKMQTDWSLQLKLVRENF